MDSPEQRLEKIFETVFPEVSPGEIRKASQDRIKNWDSIAAITLMNLIEEEFAIEVDFDQAAELTSFDEILHYLKGRLSYTAV